MIVKERLYLDSTRKRVVKHGSKEAAYLLCAEGQELPDIIAKQYGLLSEKKQAKKEPENKLAAEPVNKFKQTKEE